MNDPDGGILRQRIDTTEPGLTADDPSSGGRDHLVIVGAGKAGTTSLHALLAEHPDVSPGPAKELHYFDLVETPRFEEYRSLFEPRGGNKLLLDATPAYLHLPYVSECLGNLVPKARLIAILRDPVARAHSDWWMHVSRGDEGRSFEEAVAQELSGPTYDQLAADPAMCRRLWRQHMESIGSGGVFPTFYLTAGLYDRHMAALRQHFDPSRILVLFFEEIVADASGLAQRLSEFLQIDPAALGQDLPAENTAVGARTMALRRLRRRRSVNFLTELTPGVARRAIRARLISADAKPGIPEVTETALREYFREPNERLVQMLGRPLPW